MPKIFPKDFLWGAATSSYQIEGSLDADGRGPSVWDTFAARPGAIEDGTDGRGACDHYRRYRQDVGLMSELGLQAYRFSIAWPRIQPTGRGPGNAAGLDFYDRLVDALLEKGIEPYVTLNHWDIPQALHDAGGWPARGTVKAFVDYAEIVARRLGDRVASWCTHNEPWCISHLGFVNGEHAPGDKDLHRGILTSHHLLLSHGLAVPVIREHAKPGADVGIVLNLVPGFPASNSPADADALRRFDGMFNRWYCDPLFGRGYPQDVVDDHIHDGGLPEGSRADALPFVHPGDLEAIATPIDYLGINYYSRAICRGPEEGNAERIIAEPPEDIKTDMGWEVYPDGLRRLLVDVHQTYRPKALYVTENGAAYATPPSDDGRVHDTRRLNYFHGHLGACHDAIAEGVPLAGYFAWSLFDNYEWAFGYTKRFGLVWVDYDTQERIPKDSARWYRDVIAAGEVLDVDGYGDSRGDS